MIFGCDLGTREIYLFGINETEESTQYPYLRYHLEMPLGSRWYELSGLAALIHDVLIWSDQLFVEEPPYVRNMQTFLALGQICGAVLAASPAKAYTVPVTKWKHEIVGSGSANKELVASWLAENRSAYFGAAAGNQNFVDAACLALYGRNIIQGAVV